MVKVGVQDDTHLVAGFSLQYRYVSGYGPAGRHVGTNFSVVAAAGCGGQPGVTLYSSPELTEYPFDVCNTCYSPYVKVDMPIPGGLNVSEAVNLQFLFQDNDRNIQLDLPIDITVIWA